MKKLETPEGATRHLERRTAIDPNRLRDFARRYTFAWCSQDPTSVATFYSPEGSLSVNDGVPAVGRDAIAGVARGFMTTFPDLVVMMNDVVMQDHAAVYSWTFTGTNTGPGGTGSRVRVNGFEEWRIGADGLIAESHGHFDEADYQEQLRSGFKETPSGAS